MDLTKPGAGWSSASRRLGASNELPAWYAPYKHILGGYRLGYDACDCARSLFQLHNETLNIWSHVLGLAAWVHASAAQLAAEPLASADGGTRRAHVVLYGLCALMPLASSLAHAFHCRGPAASRLAWRLDFAGIACLLSSRAALEGYLLLYCRRDLLAVWVCVATLAYGSLSILAVAYERPDALAPMFVLLHAPLVGFLATEWPSLDAAARAAARGPVRLLVLGSLSGVAGFAVRATHVPERWIRRRRDMPIFCDIVGASHQWWHVFTMVGPLLAQRGNARLFALRVGSTCPAT